MHLIGHFSITMRLFTMGMLCIVICFLITFSEISEIVHFPARLDVLPISGVLYFTEGQSESHISLRAVADVEAESNEAFAVKLISAHGGAIISTQDSLAKLTGLLYSNYATASYINGQFC